MSKSGALVALLIMLAGCAGASSTRGLSEERAARTVETVLNDIDSIYYKETQAANLVAAGFARIGEEFSDITFEREGDAFVAMVRGERAYAFQPEASGWTAYDWAPQVAAMLNHAETLRGAGDEPDLSALVDSFIEGIVDSLDGRSRYTPRRDVDAYLVRRSRSIGTIGITIERSATGWEVESLCDTTLLLSKSLQPGDVITEVDGTPVDTLSKREILNLFYGEIGSPVVFMIERGATARSLSVTLPRTKSGDNLVLSLPAGKSTRIIVIGLSDKAVADLRTILHRQDNIGLGNSNGLILDLRGNPGGLLTATLEIAEMFLTRGPIFTTHGRHPESHQDFKAAGGSHTESPPLVVLLDKESASGSEIVAAALQDRGRAVVIGSSSFGVGTITTSQLLPDNSGLSLSWTEVYTPNNYRLNKRGVMPTVCTSGAATAEDVIADLLAGARYIDHATRTRDIDPDDAAAVAAFRALCPPGSDGNDVSLAVAVALLADIELYSKVLLGGIERLEVQAN